MIFDGALETDRLRIRPFEPSDASILVSIFADPDVARFVGDGEPMSEGNAARWVHNSRENLRRFGYGTGAVTDRSDGRVVGWAGFSRPDDQPEQIIYGLITPYWSHGYGGEIVTALVDFADERSLGALYATVDPANVRSVRLLLRHGFQVHTRGYRGETDTDLFERP